jgi:S-DNA-T family DNA segregation ATPase FtsK/SpoIIIE
MNDRCTRRFIYRCLAIFYLSSLVFLFLSLISFNPYDPSLLCIYDSPHSSTNIGGAAGAYAASLLIGFLGVAAYYILFLLAYIGYVIFWASAVYLPLEQLIASAMGFVIAPLFATTLGNLIGVSGAGGAIGASSLRMLKAYCDPILLPFLVFSIALAWLCIVTQNAWIAVCMYILRGIRQIMLHPYMRVGYRLIYKVLYNGVWYVHRLLQIIYRLLTGHEIVQDKDTVVAYELERWLEEVSKEKSKVTITPSTLISSSQTVEQTQEKEERPHAPMATRTSTARTNEPYAIPLDKLFKKEKQASDSSTIKEQHEADARTLEAKLERFGIYGRVINIQSGPVITHFSYEPSIDTKVSRILAFEDDLALALQAMSVRIIAPVPGTNLVGFEVARKERRMVLFSQGIRSQAFTQSKAAIPLLLGEDSTGATLAVDLAAMPHLLIAGSTGSGKSIALNTMLISMVCRHSPEQLRLLLIDPKRLEFASYAGIGHLLQPIITDPRKVVPALTWIVRTMEERYELMSQIGVRNIFDYHKKAQNDASLPSMPFIVVVIDELADLMMTAPREIEDLLARIAQMARAAGIHMIVATQRPSVDVITGLIKVNFPCRISFKVTSKIDSRTILDCVGADKLLGKGDMLFLNESSQIKRAHGAFVSDDEINALIKYIRTIAPEDYLITEEEMVQAESLDDTDDLIYPEVLAYLSTIDEISISQLQRRFRIGYNRSARLIERLEAEGIILKQPGNKRKVVH